MEVLMIKSSHKDSNREGTKSVFHHICPCLLVSDFVFISVTFSVNPFCIFRFLGLFSCVSQYWSGILSNFSCSSTAFSFINSCIGLLPVITVITSMGVVFTAPVISLRAWFWACSSTLSLCGWAVTRESQLYVMERICFWYIKFKVDQAHPHFLLDVSKHFCAWKLARWFYPCGFSNLTCRRSHQGTWIHLIGRELYFYTSTLDVLFCELGRRTEKLFLRCLSSYYFSHTLLPV